ncbi:hypothetical protein VTK56DRAFT_5283 [Thermocarpiscus australiensis]
MRTDDQSEHGSDWTNGWRTGSGSGSDSDSDSDNDEEPPRGVFAVTSAFLADDPPLTPQHKQAQHAAWLPFTHFLGRLPGLTDLLYACTHQIPLCILTALHQRHPRIRLHVHAFSLRSLYQDMHQLHDIDPDEFALATSPCLYSIDAKWEAYNTHGHVSYNSEAIARMVAGCAPALRRVRIQYSQPGNSLSLLEAIRSPRPPWQGFFLARPDRRTTNSEEVAARPGGGRLDTLVLSSNDEIEDWSNYTDFAVLRRFELNCITTVRVLETLTSMASSSKFQSLRELGLAIVSDQYRGNDSRSLDEPASLFLLAVPPLEVLEISSFVGKRTIEAALRRHGQTLRKLHLSPDHKELVLSRGQVREIQQRCPKLEDIQLLIRRHHGGPEEVAIYRTLGRLPRLRRVALQLDCRLSSPPCRENRDEDLRKMLINFAVDEALARAIFREICATAAGTRLERLKLEVDVPSDIGERYGCSGFRDLAKWVGRSWVCTRTDSTRRGAGRSDVTVREVLVDRWWWEHIREDDDLDWVEPECLDAWSAIWPRRAEDWRDDWASFPLAVEQGVEAPECFGEESVV